jgi:hypothetical protein
VKLKVFLSWSKYRSFVIANALKALLADLFDSAEPLMSEDVEIGGPVLPNLNSMLREADFVVLCLTAENWQEPWLFYEAGVVFGKTDRTGLVCPYIIDLHLKRRNLPEPLKQFRAVMADKDGTFQLIRKINSELEHPLPEAKLKKSFGARWPRLKKIINQPDPRACVKDFKEVSERVYEHQAGLEPRLRACIDVAVAAVQSGTYDHEEIVDFTYREIDANKEKFRNGNSLLVGNVADFFDEHFTKATLREIVKLMESDMLGGGDAATMRDKLVARMRIALDDAFKVYHRILSDRLGVCLG